MGDVSSSQNGRFAAGLLQKLGVGATALRHTILPPVCLACDSGVAAQGAVCATCWSSLRHIERPWCDIMGSPFSYDLGKGALSAQAIANPPAFDRARSVVLYDDVARQMVQALKFSDRTDIAPWLAKWMARFVERAEIDFVEGGSLIVPVPLHKRRLLARRFNQSAELARPFARETGARYAHEVLVRIRSTKQQLGLGAKERHRNVRGAFRVPTEQKIHVNGAKIVVIDDVFTTGATLEACARALRRAGAAEINCLTFARVASGDI